MEIRQMLISGEMQIGMSATILIALIVVTFKLSSYISALKNSIDDNSKRITNVEDDADKRISKVEDDTEDIKSKNHFIELTQAVLNTKLENIEAGIVEIKALLKIKEKQ